MEGSSLLLFDKTPEVKVLSTKPIRVRNFSFGRYSDKFEMISIDDKIYFVVGHTTIEEFLGDFRLRNAREFILQRLRYHGVLVEEEPVDLNFPNSLVEILRYIYLSIHPSGNSLRSMNRKILDVLSEIEEFFANEDTLSDILSRHPKLLYINGKYYIIEGENGEYHIGGDGKKAFDSLKESLENYIFSSMVLNEISNVYSLIKERMSNQRFFSELAKYSSDNELRISIAEVFDGKERQKVFVGFVRRDDYYEFFVEIPNVVVSDSFGKYYSLGRKRFYVRTSSTEPFHLVPYSNEYLLRSDGKRHPHQYSSGFICLGSPENLGFKDFLSTIKRTENNYDGYLILISKILDISRMYSERDRVVHPAQDGEEIDEDVGARILQDIVNLSKEISKRWLDEN